MIIIAFILKIKKQNILESGLLDWPSSADCKQSINSVDAENIFAHSRHFQVRNTNDKDEL